MKGEKGKKKGSISIRGSYPERQTKVPENIWGEENLAEGPMFESDSEEDGKIIWESVIGVVTSVAVRRLGNKKYR